MGRIDADELSNRGASYLDGLLSLSELGLRGRQFRLHSRFIRTWPQLRAHQCVDAIQKNLPTTYGCAGRFRCLLRGDNG